MLSSLRVPLWFFVLESLYRNRITLLNDKFDDDTSIVFIQRDLAQKGVVISYNHLLRIFGLLVKYGFVTRKEIHREVVHTLTFKGNDFVKGMDYNTLYQMWKN